MKYDPARLQPSVSLMSSEISSPMTTQGHGPRAASHVDELEIAWQVELYELLGEVDHRIHRVMQRFVESAEVTKSQIGDMLEGARRTGTDDQGALIAELDELRHRVNQLAAASPHPNHDATVAEMRSKAQSAVQQTQLKAESELAQIRRVVSHLQSIEQSIARLIGRELGPPPSVPPVAVAIIIHDIGSYQRVVALIQAIVDGASIIECDIHSYRPSRLDLMVRCMGAASAVHRIGSASPILLTRLADESGTLVYRAGA